MYVALTWQPGLDKIFYPRVKSQISVGLSAQVSYRILGRGYFSVSLFAGNKCTEIEGRGSHLK